MIEIWSIIKSTASSPPSALVQWVTFALAAMLAFFKLWAWILARLDKTRDSDVRFDDSWFKVVVFDDVLPALGDFLRQHRGVFANPPSPPTGVAAPRMQHYMGEFQKDAERLKSRLSAVELLSKSAFQCLIHNIESLDDEVTNCCYKLDNATDALASSRYEQVMSSLFDKCYRDSLHTLRVTHKALYKIKKDNESSKRSIL